METQQEQPGAARADDSTEQIVRLKPVRDKLDHLKELAVAAKEAATDLSEALDAVAAAARVDKTALRAFVSAQVSDKTRERKARAEQLALLFDEVGA